MNNRTATLNKVFEYKEFQSQFSSICKALASVLVPDNDYGIEIGSGNENSQDISILGHPCRMAFGVHSHSGEFQGSILGKITFQRLLPQERTDDFLTTYYDHLGNATEDPTKGFHNSLSGDDLLNWLVIRVLGKFFENLEASE